MPSQTSHPSDVFKGFGFSIFLCRFLLNDVYWCNNPTQLFEVDDWMNEFVHMFRSNFDGWNQPNQKEMSWWVNFVTWDFVDKRPSKDSWMHIWWNHEMLWCSMDKCYGNLRDYLRWLDECDYVKKTSMDEIVHCDELWCTIMNDNGTITTFEMFSHSCKNGWLWWCQ